MDIGTKNAIGAADEVGSLDAARDLNQKFDRALLYAVGDLSASEREQLELGIIEGDVDTEHALEQLQELFSTLHYALPSVTPPPFAKERVMAAVHADIAQPKQKRRRFGAFGAVAGISGSLALPRTLRSNLHAPKPRFPRVSTSLLRTSWIKPLAALGVFAVIGSFGSAYALEVVERVAQTFREVVLGEAPKSVRHTASTASVQQPKPSAEIHYSELPLVAPSVIEIAQPAQMTMANVGIADAAIEHAKNVPAPVKAASIPAFTETMKTNLGVTEAQMYLQSNPRARVFMLKPTTSVATGRASVTWDNVLKEAVLNVNNLKPTAPNERYVLQYVDANGDRQRIHTFNVFSEARQASFVRTINPKQVREVRLTIERLNGETVESSEDVLAATSSTPVTE